MMRFLGLLLALAGWVFAVPVAAQVVDLPDTVKAVRKAPPAVTDKENLWLLDLSDGGRVTILLRPDAAPNMVERIKLLTRQHFYDGLAFHRVIEGFMAQGGDPKGDGTGGSKLPDLKAEFNYLPHVRGAVSAARLGADPDATPEEKKAKENTANSQFFIVFQPRLALDGKYTVFGRVIDGMQYVDAIERGEPPANPTRILHAWIAADPHPDSWQPAPPPPPTPDLALPSGKPTTLPAAPAPKR